VYKAGGGEASIEMLIEMLIRRKGDAKQGFALSGKEGNAEEETKGCHRMDIEKRAARIVGPGTNIKRVRHLGEKRILKGVKERIYTLRARRGP